MTWMAAVYGGMACATLALALPAAHPTRPAEWAMLFAIGILWPLFLLWTIAGEFSDT